MATDVGIIGPKDSMNLIFEVGSEYEALQLNAYSYEEIQDIVDIFETHTNIKYWLFSGQAPYSYALEKGYIDETHSSFIPLMGSGLIRTLLYAVYHEGYALERISFDTYLEREIKEVFSELAIQLKYCSVLPYGGYMDEEKIVSFHESEYKSGKIDIAVTCIQSVYRVLKKKGIPVIRVLPTRNVIRQTFQLLEQKIETGQYLDSSIAILSLSLFKEHQHQGELYSYKFKKELLKVEEHILSYAQTVNGSMVRIGDMLYFIFTTRGALDTTFGTGQSLTSWLDDLSNMIRFKVHAGVGYGDNVFNAEKNSRLALQYAQQHEPMSYFLVDEDGKVEGPVMQEETALSYSPRSVDEHVFENLKISPMQWSRVQAYVKKYSKNEFTANELADWMQVTDRNARKILNELEKACLVKIVGEEQPGPKGRPRKVYRVE